MGSNLGSALGRFARSLGMSDATAKIVAILLVVGIIVWILFLLRQDKKQIDSGAFKSFSLPGDKDTLHIAPQGYRIPNNSSEVSKLRGFQSAEEIFQYVYKEFGEAVFQQLVIHASDSEQAEFVFDPAQSDEENIARLGNLLPV